MEQRRGEEVVVAFDAATGDTVWENGWPARHYDTLSKEGPRATPAIAGDAVLALGALGELRCLDLASGSSAGDVRCWRKATTSSATG